VRLVHDLSEDPAEDETGGIANPLDVLAGGTKVPLHGRRIVVAHRVVTRDLHERRGLEVRERDVVDRALELGVPLPTGLA